MLLHSFHHRHFEHVCLHKIFAILWKHQDDIRMRISSCRGIRCYCRFLLHLLSVPQVHDFVIYCMCGVERSHWRGWVLPYSILYYSILANSDNLTVDTTQELPICLARRRECTYVPIRFMFLLTNNHIHYLTVALFLSKVEVNLVISKKKKKSNGWPFFNSRTGT